MTREIHIKPVLNGFIVNIGCQSVVFDSRSKLLAELGRYLENPRGLEVEYRKNALNPEASPEVPEPRGLMTAQEERQADYRLTGQGVTVGR